MDKSSRRLQYLSGYRLGAIVLLLCLAGVGDLPHLSRLAKADRGELDTGFNASGNSSGNKAAESNSQLSGTVQFSSATFSVAESSTEALITITRSDSTGAASVIAQLTSGGTALHGISCSGGADYLERIETNFNWVAGDTTDRAYRVSICPDDVFEGDETINLILRNATGATLGTPNTTVLTIIDNDPLPAISLGDRTRNEGNSGPNSFFFTIVSGRSQQPITVNYSTADGTATAGSDYVATSGTLVIPPYSRSVDFPISVNGDRQIEPDETFSVNLTNPVNATISDGLGSGTIVNDDDFYFQLFPATYSVNENAGTATIDVRGLGNIADAVSVNYATSNGTAMAGSDYTATSGTLTFMPGDPISKSFTIPIIDNALNEPDETVNLTLSNPTGGSMLGVPNTAILTIIDNDPDPNPQPTIAVNDVTLSEGNSGTTNFNFTVSLSTPLPQTITVNYATADGTATAGSDYTATSGTLTFVPGQTAQLVTVGVNGDAQVEPDETFSVNLTNPVNATISDGLGSGTIINDDATVQFFPATYTVNEGGGTITLTITLATLNNLAASVDYSTLDGTATQRTRYITNSGTLSFAAGETLKTITIILEDNALVDGSQQFSVILSNPQGATLNGPVNATITINDNDAPPITTNPLETHGFFVRQQYYDFLARVPDQAGLNFWTGQITQPCNGNPVCISQRRWQVSNAFFYEQEFQQTGSYVYRLYRAAYGNAQPFPNAPGDNDANPYCQQAGCPWRASHIPAYEKFVNDRARVVGSADLAAAQLAFAGAFVQRVEFTARYPLSQTAAQFVDALLANIQAATGANLTSQRDALIAVHNTNGRGGALNRLADDNAATNPINNRAFIDAEYSRAFVLTQYFGYLRRDPDMPGLNFWLRGVNRFPLRDATGQNAMVCAFITSAEYQTRFSLITPRTDIECPTPP